MESEVGSRIGNRGYEGNTEIGAYGWTVEVYYIKCARHCREMTREWRKEDRAIGEGWRMKCINKRKMDETMGLQMMRGMRRMGRDV